MEINSKGEINLDLNPEVENLIKSFDELIEMLPIPAQSKLTMVKRLLELLQTARMDAFNQGLAAAFDEEFLSHLQVELEAAETPRELLPKVIQFPGCWEKE